MQLIYSPRYLNQQGESYWQSANIVHGGAYVVKEDSDMGTLVGYIRYGMKRSVPLSLGMPFMNRYREKIKSDKLKYLMIKYQMVSCY